MAAMNFEALEELLALMSNEEAAKTHSETAAEATACRLGSPAGSGPEEEGEDISLASAVHQALPQALEECSSLAPLQDDDVEATVSRLGALFAKHVSHIVQCACFCHRGRSRDVKTHDVNLKVIAMVESGGLSVSGRWLAKLLLWPDLAVPLHPAH